MGFNVNENGKDVTLHKVGNRNARWLRRQVDGLIDSIPERDLPIIEATARGIIETRAETEE